MVSDAFQAHLALSRAADGGFANQHCPRPTLPGSPFLIQILTDDVLVRRYPVAHRCGGGAVV